MTTLEARVVEAWHEALNSGGTERLVKLSYPEVEGGGPRGAGRGAELLREWVDRANVRLEPRRVFHRGDKVVVEEGARWRVPDTGRVSGAGTVASVFVVGDGRVSSIVRHDALSGALRAAGLGEADEEGVG